MQQIILASSSTYRRQILDKLGIHYQWQAPHINEAPLVGETPVNLVQRLAQGKAIALAHSYPNALIIGSDQVAAFDGQVLGKPGDHRQAMAQLKLTNGRKVTFLTGLCLYNPAAQRTQTCCETYQVEFRQLTDHQIKRYLEREKPYDCAGSFKAEGLGISLFSKLEGRDPNTLVGLPLIALIEMLNNEGS